MMEKADFARNWQTVGQQNRRGARDNAGMLVAGSPVQCLLEQNRPGDFPILVQRVLGEKARPACPALLIP